MVAGFLLSAMGNNLIAGFVAGAGLWLLILDFIYLAVKGVGLLPLFHKIDKPSLLLIVAAVAASNVILLMVIGRNQTIYYWDYVGNWLRTLISTEEWFSSPLDSFAHMYQSINHDEYNYSITFLLSAPMKLLGSSFYTFCVAILNLLLVPAAFVLAGAAEKARMAVKGGCSPRWFALFFAVILLHPVAIRPVVLGYLNASGFLGLALVYLLMLDGFFFSFSVRKSLLLAGAVLLTLFGQRAFAYGIAGFAASCIVVFLYTCIAERLPKQKLLAFVKNMLLAGGTSLAVLLLFFREFVQRGLFNNFSFAYSAYQHASTLGNFVFMFKTFGIIPTGLCMVGVVLGIVDKKARLQTLFLSCALLVESGLFFQVQSLDVHHYYIVLPALLLLCLQGIYMAAGYVGRVWVPVVCGALFAFNTMQNCLFPVLNLPSLPGFSQASIAPMVRKDLMVISALVSDLNAHFPESPVYVAASGTTLNNDILIRSAMPENYNILPQVQQTSHVDLRDGFPEHFFEAEAVVITDPAEGHLPDDHLVTYTIVELFLDGAFDEHFVHIGSYPLDNGVTALVYRRTSPLDDDDHQLLASRFDEYYPEYPELFSDRILRK